MIGPSWFTCCVGKDHKDATAQFVMPSHVKGQPMPGFAGGSNLGSKNPDLRKTLAGRALALRADAVS